MVWSTPGEQIHRISGEKKMRLHSIKRSCPSHLWYKTLLKPQNPRFSSQKLRFRQCGTESTLTPDWFSWNKQSPCGAGIHKPTMFSSALRSSTPNVYLSLNTLWAGKKLSLSPLPEKHHLGNNLLFNNGESFNWCKQQNDSLQFKVRLDWCRCCQRDCGLYLSLH